MASYFHEWNAAGVTRMWLDLTNMQQQVPLDGAQCDMRYSNTGQSPSFTSWEADQPKCLDQSHSCAYMNLEKTKDNWLSEGCTSREAFACSMPAPFALSPTQKPTSNLTCYNDASWTLNFYLNEDNGQCYSFSNYYNGSNLLLFKDEAVAHCESFGAKLLQIESEDESAFLMKHIMGNSWLGITFGANNNQYPPNEPQFWDDGTPISFTNWRDGSPQDDSDKLCAQIKGDGLDDGLWKNCPCELQNGKGLKKYPICIRPAVTLSTTKVKKLLFLQYNQFFGI